MYKNSKKTMRVEGKRSKWFDVNIGVHQGLISSPFLLAIVLDDIYINFKLTYRPQNFLI